VESRLNARGIEPADVAWDAWRREDGRWTVRMEYQANGSQQLATWIYDSAARTITSGDGAAQELIDPAPEPLPLRLQPIDLTEAATEAVALEAPPRAAKAPVPAPEAAPAAARVPASPIRPAGPASAGNRKPRATVPSWDEILFGPGSKPKSNNSA
jgi:hypothetical protein